MRRETFATPGPVSLELRVPAGEVEVDATAEVAETTVELEPLGGEAAAAAVEAARVELRDRRDGSYEVLVEVRPERRFGLFRDSPEVRVAVRCPAGARLAVSTASADVRARGRFAAADVEAASGDVEIDEVEGEAQAQAASGGVSIRHAGGARVNTASGDVELGRLAGEGRVRTASGDVLVGLAESSLDVQTASGDQRVDEVASGRVTLRAASGDVVVGVRRGVGVWIDASSMSGSTSSELDLGGEPGGAEEPTVELRVTTMSGDVRIVRAAGSGGPEA
jgi:hypothetical protein